MKLLLTPALLSGRVTPPPSKSQSHRVLMAAALAEGTSHISGLGLSQDIEATAGCLRVLGARISPDCSEITGVGDFRTVCAPCLCDALHFDCGESGSTLRFLIPVALAVARGGFFTGRGRLMDRPQQPYADLFAEKGIFFRHTGNVISVQGDLTPGRFSLRGDVSSQFVTGLLYALPLLPGDSEIVLTTPLESRSYVNMTLRALEQFGVRARFASPGVLSVPGGQRYLPADVTVEGDWSQAGFYYAANGLGSRVEILGLDPDSPQGDRVAADYSARLARPGDVTLDVSDCPDLVPALSVQAALRDGGRTDIVGAGRLRLKESDRLDAITVELCKLGAQVEQTPDSLAIRGVSTLRGGPADSRNDHRIAMMLAVAATRCLSPVILSGAESVRKSYPGFWDDYRSLGGITEEFEP